LRLGLRFGLRLGFGLSLGLRFGLGLRLGLRFGLLLRFGLRLGLRFALRLRLGFGFGLLLRLGLLLGHETLLSTVLVEGPDGGEHKTVLEEPPLPSVMEEKGGTVRRIGHPEQEPPPAGLAWKRTAVPKGEESVGSQHLQPQ
jgi:hypothetical protein